MDSGVEFAFPSPVGLGGDMKFCLLLGMALCVGCTALLLAQGKQSTSDQKPSATKSDKEGQDGPIDIPSDTGGVNVHPYLDRALPLLKTSWYKFIPESAALKRGKVTVTFSIVKDGHINDVHFAEKSGDTDLDKAAYLGRL
jgi:outer membrane biosynthesis protein TonB